MKKFFLRQLTVFFIFLFIHSVSYAQSNQYLHFDGVDDYTELPNAAQYIGGSNTITMTGWFYTDQLNYGQGMMSIRGGGTGDGEMYFIQLDNGKLECRVVTSTGLHQVQAPAGTIQAGVWQHIAWVFNETSVELFVDGVSIGSSTASGTFNAFDRPLSIGKAIASGLNFVFKGRADEVSLWSKALSQTEIQAMMSNELEGNEANLEVYYKFNQGTPAGNNTNVSQLLSKIDQVNRSSELRNFELLGEESNFNGTIAANFQVINFQPIPNKLTTDTPFEAQASVNSGLPISFEIVSGPATVEGNIITLTGQVGEVLVKASQSGNATFDAAEDAFVNFQVLNPQQVLADIEITHPLTGEVLMPSLIPIEVTLKASIQYPELFSVSEISVQIEDENVLLTNHGNGFYTGWWRPKSYGNKEVNIIAKNNFGAVKNMSHNVIITDDIAEQTFVYATEDVWVNGDFPSKTVEADLPSYIGAFDKITGSLYIDCPTGGCDPWDRVSSIEAQGKNGEWYEIIRYLTPYGVSCQSEIDLTDFASLLKGKTKFRVNLATQGNGFLYSLELNYQGGTPVNPYSTIQKLWNQTYQFGDIANLQPTEELTLNFPDSTKSAKIKLVSSGHGWGENNTGNAAEFQENTHHVWVNGAQTFEQNNWNDCNPNPDNCQRQQGTWQYDRAGWCPGSIAQFFDYNMESFIDQGSVTLKYIFDESYTDFCHPNNPDCVTGVTCDNCDDGFNPHLIVTSYLISFENPPVIIETPTDSIPPLGIDDNRMGLSFSLYPNPSTGRFFIDFDSQKEKANSIIVYNSLGNAVRTIQVDKTYTPIEINLGNNAVGIYFITIYSKEKIIGTRKVVIE